MDTPRIVKATNKHFHFHLTRLLINLPHTDTTPHSRLSSSKANTTHGYRHIFTYLPACLSAFLSAFLPAN